MNNKQVREKFIKHLTKNGNKAKAEKVFLQSMKALSKDSKKQPITLLKIAIINSMPVFKVRKFTKKNKKDKQIREIPEFIKTLQARASLGIKFIIEASKKNKNKSSCYKIKEELINSAKKTGEAIRMRDELQKKVVGYKFYYRAYYKF